MFVRWKTREHATAIQRGRARCDHLSASTVLWTPLLLHSERRDGVSRHVQLARLTSIRGCCIRDPDACHAWWEAIARDLADLEMRGLVGDPRRDPRCQQLFVALASVVLFDPTHRNGRLPRAWWIKRSPHGTDVRAAEPTDATCFAFLGLTPACTADELKRAWRRIAVEHHPDRGGDADAFRRAKVAYDLCRQEMKLA
ncbi:MAG: J domain-containing protein [Polyangiales bacterium]